MHMYNLIMPDGLLDQIAHHRKEYLRLTALAETRGIIARAHTESAIGPDQFLKMITELDDANKQLASLVMTDSLTGIGNRRLFLSRLENMLHLAERDQPLSVILIDIDNFKSFNDTFGHQAGDAAIFQVADILSRKTRKADCVARYGGEEFAVATSVGMDGAATLGEKLRASVEGMPNIFRQVTISLGVASFSKNDTMSDLIGRADRLLYRSKAAGRNRVTTIHV